MNVHQLEKENKMKNIIFLAILLTGVLIGSFGSIAYSQWEINTAKIDLLEEYQDCSAVNGNIVDGLCELNWGDSSYE